MLVNSQENYAGLRSKPFFGGLVSYFSSGPIVAMVWEGKDSIKVGRKMVDDIRESSSVHYARNVIDGSDSSDGAREEILFWFTSDEVSNYSRAVDTIAY